MEPCNSISSKMLAEVVKLLYIRRSDVEHQIHGKRQRLAHFHKQLQDQESDTEDELTSTDEFDSEDEAEFGSEKLEINSADDTDVNSVNTEERDELRSSLIDFYKVHNPDKILAVDKILHHFNNRIEALNEALMVSYGSGLTVKASKPTINSTSATAKPARSNRAKPDAVESMMNDKRKEKLSDVEMAEITAAMETDKADLHALKYDLHRLRYLHKTALEEYFLPKSESFQFRFISISRESGKPKSGSSSKTNTVSIIGAKDILIDNIAGFAKLEISCPVQRTGHKECPRFRLWTTSPLSIKARVIGFKYVQDCHSQSPTVHYFENLSLEAEIKINICFDFNPRKGLWVKPVQHVQVCKVSRLSTHMMTITDQLLRTIVNSMLPPLLLKVIQRHLPPELGKLLYTEKKNSDFSRTKADPNLKVSLEMKFTVTGWPALKDWDTNLVSAEKNGNTTSRRKRILKRLNVSEDQLSALQRAVHSLSKTKTKMKFWKSKGGATSEPLTLKDLLTFHELIVDKNSDQNIFQKSKSVRGHFSKSKRLMQELQTYVDAENNSSGTTTWRLDDLMNHIGDILLKPLALEIDISDIDVAVDVDKFFLQLKSFLWRLAKANHNAAAKSGYKMRNLNRYDTLGEELKKIHQLSNALKFWLETFKSFVQTSKILFTGAFTGGKCPVYELCVKDLDVTGVTDAVLVNFRLGGQLPTLIKYVDSLMRRIGLNVSQNNSEEADLFSRVKEEVMNNLDLFQFFFEISTVTTGEIKLSLLDDKVENVDDDSWTTNQEQLVLSIRGRRDDPRPPLSLHVRGTVVETLDLIQGKVKPNNVVDANGDSSSKHDDDKISQRKSSGNGIEVYEMCMQLVHNQGIVFPALPNDILTLFTIKQQQSHVFYLAKLVLSSAFSSSSANNKKKTISDSSSFIGFSASRKVSLTEFENLVLLSGELFYLSDLSTEDDPLLSGAAKSTKPLGKGHSVESSENIRRESLNADATDSNASESEAETDASNDEENN